MTDEIPRTRNVNLKIWQIILIAMIAMIAITVTAIWLKTYESLNEVIWVNEFVKANRWTIPAGDIFFSLLVGLCLKYLHAPDVIHGGFTDSMKGEGAHSDYKTFPGTLPSSFFPFFQGQVSGRKVPWHF